MKILAIVGGVVLLVGLVIAGGAGYFIYSGVELDRSSRQYIEANIPPIISAWSQEELLLRAAPELRELIAKHAEDSSRLFKTLARLGPMDSFEVAGGEAHISITSKDGKVVTASYSVQAKFKNGDATIDVRLIQRSGNWQITYFHVNSPIFLDSAAGKAA